MNKSKRRLFLKKGMAGILGLGIVSAIGAFAKSRTEKNKNFIHVVFFWLKDPQDTAASNRFEEELNTLTGDIKVIKSAHIGKPAPTDRPVIDNSYHYSLILSFKNKQDQDIYQEHPVHLKFIENASDLWEKVVVYDSQSI